MGKTLPLRDIVRVYKWSFAVKAQQLSNPVDVNAKKQNFLYMSEMKMRHKAIEENKEFDFIL